MTVSRYLNVAALAATVGCKTESSICSVRTNGWTEVEQESGRVLRAQARRLDTSGSVVNSQQAIVDIPHSLPLSLPDSVYSATNDTLNASDPANG